MKIVIKYILLLSIIYPEGVRIGSYVSVKGDVVIVHDDKTMPVANAISGNTLFNNVKIRTSINSEATIAFDDKGTMIHLDPKSEIYITVSNVSKNFDLLYGSMFIHNSSGSSTDSYIFTLTSRAIVKDAKVWVNRDVSLGKDEFFCLDGSLRVYNDLRNVSKDIEASQRMLSMKNGFIKIADYSTNPLPSYLKDGSIMSIENKDHSVQYSHTSDKKKPHDLIPLYGQQTWEPKTKDEGSSFGFNISLGRFLMNVSDTTYPYYKMGLQPKFYSKQIRFQIDLDGFINTGDGDDLNDMSSIFDYFDRLIYFQYKSFDKRLVVQFGQINSITFGHGHLVKGYSNIVDYPRTRNSGLYFNYRTDKRNISLDGFVSSIRDFQRGGGIIGIHGTIFLSESFPLTIGASFVRDFNQFAAVSDFGDEWSSWYEENSDVKRGINSLEFDYTYDLISINNTKLFLFGEMVGMYYPDTYYYARLGTNTIEDPSGEVRNYPQKVWRNGTWGITVPGLWIKYRHLWDFKVSLQLNSALHIPQYFSSTYNFERIRYAEYQFSNIQINDFTELTDLYCKYALDQDSCPVPPSDEGSTSDEKTTTELLLPKEFYSLVDSTQNKFPTWGFVSEYDFHYKELFSGNFSFSMFKEISDTDDNDTFYNYGIDIYSDDNIFEGISELRVYYKQFFTNNLPWSSDNLYHENMIRGAKVGIKINKFLSGIIDIHDVFYDQDLDGVVDRIRMSSFELQVRL